MPAPRQLFQDESERSIQEQFTPLLTRPGVRIERIVSHGHASPLDFWYDQPQGEWVVVLKGAARLQFEAGFCELQPGDYIEIPAHTRHRVDWTTPDEPTVWLAVHYGAQSENAAESSPIPG